MGQVDFNCKIQLAFFLKIFYSSIMVKRNKRNILKKARLDKGWSKSELSRQSGVNRDLIRFLEDGVHNNVKSGTLVKLANALGINVAELYYLVK